KYDGPNLFYYSQAVKNIDGNVDLGDNLRFSADEKDRLLTGDATLLNQMRYRRAFVSFASCEARLNMPNEVAIVRHDQPPSDSINVLYRDKTLLRRIDEAIAKIFRFRFILLDHIGTNLQLGLSFEEPPQFNTSADNLQDEFEKIESWKREQFTSVTDAGHGI